MGLSGTVWGMTTKDLLRWVGLGGVFMLPFIPLLVAHSLFFPFITGKNFTFRIIVEVITAAWIGLAILEPRYRPSLALKKAWPLYAAGAFVAIIGIADMLGANPFKSVWSNFERMEGWVTLVHLFLFLVVSSTVLNTEKLWKYWWHTSIGVSMLIAFYGFLQLAGFIVINQGGRLDATFGNSTYLAIYMVFHMFMTAVMWARYGAGSRALAYTYGTIIALQGIMMFFTETRGAVLGALGGALLAAFITLIFSRQSVMVWRITVGVVVAIVIVAGGAYLLRDTSFVRNSKPLSRLTSISLSDGTVTARFMNWGMAWEGVKERPVLGWGQESYNFVFNKYYNPQMYAQEPWFDRVHNVIFDWLIAGGFLGLIAYLTFFASVVVAAWCAPSPIERGLLIGLLGGYFFYLLFTFDNITSSIMFYAVTAYLVSRLQHDKAVGTSPDFPEAVRYSVVLGVVLLAVGSVWLINIPAIEANQNLIQAVQSQSAGITKNIEYFELAAGSGTLGSQEAREHMIQGAAQLASNQSVSAADKQKFFQSAEREMLAQIERVPGDARFHLFLGVLYDSYGQFEKGKAQLEKARELSPNKQQIRLQLGMNALNRGALDEALTIFADALALAPEYNQARIFYASALIRAGQLEKAEEIMQPLSAEDRADQRFMAAYATINRYDKILPMWEAKVAANPQDPQARFTLAAVYYQMGNKEKAIEVLEQTARDIPSTKAQVDQVITDVKNGTVKIQ